VLAITNGKIYTITNGIIERGTVLIENGKIKAVGANVAVPAGAAVIDATGKVVMPGLIDAHSHIGIFGEPMDEMNVDGNEMTNPATPEVRGMDGLNPNDPAFKDVLTAGVTTVYTGPGSGNVIGGTGAAYKTVGRTVEEMMIPGTEMMKMALGENPKRVYGSQKKLPMTRMGNAAVLRNALIQAQNYLEKRRRAEAKAKEEGKEPEYPERDLRWEVLGKVVSRQMKARIHAHRADDILTAIRIAREFNLDFVIEHATEGYKIADILAAEKVPCVVGPLLIGRYKLELQDITLRNPGILARAGVKIAIQMDDSSETRWLPVNVGLAIREGLPEEEGFRAVTINAAEILGIADRLGSLEPGKDADIAIFDGHPFQSMTHCVYTIIDGKVVYKRED